ncbi:MAG: class I SAM-dependent methyltransferase [Candidatus Nanohaloarchaea archaeon]
MLPLHSIAAYIITRKVKPEKIVETGVHHGKSTTCILRAIQKNQGGFLHSIDLPKTVDPNNPYQEANVYELKEEEVGRLVPDELKSRWNLHLGDSRDILPKILEEIGPIDFFMHDSMHSYEVMSFEFKHALNSLNEEGVLLSDDVDWNNAFQDFVSKHKPDLNKAGDTSDIPKKYSENMSVIGLMSK